MVSKITPEEVNDIMEDVSYHVMRIEGSTTMIAVAMYKGFSLGIGRSACINPDDFVESLGRKYAIEEAEKKSRDMIWELEGWHRLRTSGTV